jgi:antitoxin component YwqK of YwqJK toxin-antitoxin module
MLSFKKHLLPFFLTISLVGCGYRDPSLYILEPNLTSINIIDRNGLTETINNTERLEQYSLVNFLQPQPYQKVLRIYSRDAEGNIPACITSYHPNGYPHKYLEVMNSRACGEYKEWYPNGNLKISASVIEGVADIVEGSEKTWVFDDCNQVWDENEALQASILYAKGDLQGTSMYYHSNGNVWKSMPYVQNQLHGTVEIYLCDGALLQTTSYCNGVKEGKSMRYWNQDNIAAEEDYCEGILYTGDYYNSCGENIAHIEEGNGTRVIFGKETVVELQEYHHGIPDGKVQQLDRYGRVHSFYHIKNGCKHGEEVEHYEAVRLQQKLTPKLSIMWSDGNIQGMTKTWYDNGVQESQREISSNKKNGHSTAWYRDGSLMLIEEYEQDHLIRGEYYVKGEKFPISTVDDGKGTVTLFNSDGTLIRKIEYRKGRPCLDE